MYTKVCMLLAVLCFARPDAAWAGFFIGKDVTMAMAMYTPDASSVDAFYGLSRATSLGGGFLRLESDDESQTRELAYVQANRLLKRWHRPNAVGNLYLMGSVGSAQGRGVSGSEAAGATTIWADYETRSVYLKASVQRWWANDFNHTLTTTQVGFAPYEAEYDQWATWFVVQAQQRSGLTSATQVTPMLRLFKRSWWVELGASVNRQHEGDAFVTVMHVF